MSVQEKPSEKKVLTVQSGFSNEDEKLICHITPQDEEKTVADLIMEQAEALEQRDEIGFQKASQLRSMLDQGIYVNQKVGDAIKQVSINPETKIGDLNFVIDFQSGEAIRLAELTMQKQYTLG